MQLKGVLFDMDGTIVHTHHLWDEILANVVGERNIERFRSARKIYPGTSIKQYRSILKHEFGIDKVEHEIVDIFGASCQKVFSSSEIKFVDGFCELIDSLKHSQHQIKLALITNAPSYALDVLKRQLNLEAFFDSNIYNSDHVNGVFKPDPSIIKYALQQMNLEPQSCVMFEDSVDGIEACVRANVRSIGINTGNKLTRESGCELIFKDFVDINIKTLKDLPEEA